MFVQVIALKFAKHKILLLNRSHSTRLLLCSFFLYITLLGNKFTRLPNHCLTNRVPTVPVMLELYMYVFIHICIQLQFRVQLTRQICTIIQCTKSYGHSYIHKHVIKQMQVYVCMYVHQPFCQFEKVCGLRLSSNLFICIVCLHVLAFNLLCPLCFCIFFFFWFHKKSRERLVSQKLQQLKAN